ncbi:MAG: sulfotransferase domain-containing protein [Pseudomonadales bacterium]|jgi:hypothetical protein
MSIDRLRVMRAGIWAATAPLPGRLRREQRLAWRNRLDNRRLLAADYVFLSRAKSGRTWVRVLLSHLYQQRFGLPESELLEYDNYRRRAAGAPVVAMSHGHGLSGLLDNEAHRARLRTKPVVLLLRDPRDVAVSEYFQSTRRASRYKRALYDTEGYESPYRFVMSSPAGLGPICDQLNLWHRTLGDWPNLHWLRYESLRADPAGELARLCGFLGEDFSRQAIDAAVAFGSFESLKRKERENFFDSQRLRAGRADDPDSFKVRRGKVGGYRDYFAPDEIDEIDARLAERLDPALGYP